MSPEFIELIKSVGIPWAIIIAVGLGVYRLISKTVWPFVARIITEMVDHWKGQVTEMNDERRESFQELGDYIKTEREKNDQILESLTMLTAEIREMRQDAKSK
jgi:hypothetical protein